MIQVGPFVKFAFAKRDTARFRDDVVSWAESPESASAERWAVERLVTDACRLFEFLGLIDDELRRASRLGCLTSDEYIKADAEITTLYSGWLAASRRLEVMLRATAKDGPVADASRFLDDIREASWMLGNADRVLDDSRMIDLRDGAVDASRRGDVGPVFEDVRP
jgi:hypothetical protein